MKNLFLTAIWAFALTNCAAELSPLDHPEWRTLKIKAAGEMDRVVWCIESNQCSLSLISEQLPGSEQNIKLAKTEVWLLKEDGNIIRPIGKRSHVSVGNNWGQNDYAIYSFPGSARTDAVGVVVRINDEFLVESLLPTLGNSNSEVCQKISAVYTECQKIKEGMTRQELLKIFTTEGGLSTARHQTFVYRGSPQVKVDVEFTPSDPKQSIVDERPTDIIRKISKPYLGSRIID